MLPIGSIYREHILSFKSSPMRKDNNFKEHKIEKPPKLNYELELPNFHAANILSCLQYINH